MLQRIQTVFLLLALISIGLIFYFPILKFEGNPDVIYTVFGLRSEMDLSSISSYSMVVLILSSLIAILLLAIISLYKNRTLQMNLCRLTMFLLAGIVAALFFIINSLIKSVGNEDYIIGYGIGYFLPIVSLIFTALALNYIRKDDKLIKSVDRLR